MTYLELLELLKLLTPEQLAQTVRIDDTDSDSDIPLALWGLSKLYVPDDEVGNVTLRARYEPEPSSTPKTRLGFI
jgi:hypothetical protein